MRKWIALFITEFCVAAVILGFIRGFKEEFRPSHLITLAIIIPSVWIAERYACRKWPNYARFIGRSPV